MLNITLIFQSVGKQKSQTLFRLTNKKLNPACNNEKFELIFSLKFYLKTRIFKLIYKTFKERSGCVIRIKFLPPQSILFMAKLEKTILKKENLKHYLYCKYIDDIFFLWKEEEKKTRKFQKFQQHF